MKIAQIAPIWTSVPPIKYGGAEKIISLLTDELVRRGHQVTLFASGDSKTNAKLISVTENSPGLTKDVQLNIVNNMNHLYNMFLALEQESQFDIIHWHLSKDLAPIMFASQAKKPSVVTIHNHFYPEEMKGLQPILDHYKNFRNFISISNFHRKYFPFNFLETVYNGIDLNEFDFQEDSQEYMVWMGRFEQTKGVHLAIQSAIELKKKLKVAGPLEKNNYYTELVEPSMKNEFIEYVGEVNSSERNELLRNAKVFLNPIQWDEPFGLVVPEANACGTPVVTFEKGAMPELIKEGLNGFIVESNKLEDFIAGINRVYNLSQTESVEMRRNSRKHVEENFTTQRMTDNYEKIYQKIIEME